MNHNWDKELQFLINIRKDWCNSDYVEFLIDKVSLCESRLDVSGKQEVYEDDKIKFKLPIIYIGEIQFLIK